MDLVVCITGHTTNHAHRAIEQVLLNDKDVVHEVDFIPLLDSAGQRKQRTPVAEIQTVLRVITQLPCKNLGPLKREICEVFSRNRHVSGNNTCQSRRRAGPTQVSWFAYQARRPRTPNMLSTRSLTNATM